MKTFRSSHLLVMIATLVVLALLLFFDKQKPEEPVPLVESGDSPVSVEGFKEYIAPIQGPRPETGDSVELPLPAEGSIPGEYTVFFTNAEDLESFRRSAEDQGLKVLGSIPELYAVRVSGPASGLKALLSTDAEVDNNYLMNVPLMPDPTLWGASDLRPFGDGILGYLGIPNSPDRLTWGKGVTIAVLDTGWTGHSAIGDERVQTLDMLDSGEAGEFSGHGTAVAGLIGSVNPFAPGVSPGADILSIRVLDGNGQGDAFTLAQGILAAVSNGADIINMSLGGYGDSRVLQEAVEYATNEGVLLIAASGNDGIDRVTYPAAYDSVIGVTAVDANDNRAPFANFGEAIDIAAPGFQIHALWEEEEFIYFNGTSASAPIVAGIAARMIETGVGETPAEITEAIFSKADDTGLPGEDVQYGAGIINPLRISEIGQTGIVDLAIADLYPAVEQSDGSTFPLYVSVQNRGTDYIPGATVELSVNGTPYYYRFSGIDEGAVASIQIPVPEADLNADQPMKVTAKAVLPERQVDLRLENNAAQITLQKDPGG